MTNSSTFSTHFQFTSQLWSWNIVQKVLANRRAVQTIDHYTVAHDIKQIDETVCTIKLSIQRHENVQVFFQIFLVATYSPIDQSIQQKADYAHAWNYKNWRDILYSIQIINHVVIFILLIKSDCSCEIAQIALTIENLFLAICNEINALGYTILV